MQKYDVNEILREFKKFTSKQTIKVMKDKQLENRRDWMLDIFRKACVINSRNSSYQFWRQDYQPKELLSEEFTKQKLDDIHNNPVEAGVIDIAEEYMYNSARDNYAGNKYGLPEIILCIKWSMAYRA